MITTKDAVIKLCEALKEDESYYDSWQANIAMSFVDAFNEVYPQHRLAVHLIANTAADNFLKQLIS
jgi:hypothetical protein